MELRRTVAALMEDFVHVQIAAFHTLIRSGGCDPKLVSGLDECPGERAQRRLAVKASAARLAHKPILWVGHWLWEALDQPEAGVVVPFLAAAS